MEEVVSHVEVVVVVASVQVAAEAAVAKDLVEAVVAPGVSLPLRLPVVDGDCEYSCLKKLI